MLGALALGLPSSTELTEKFGKPCVLDRQSGTQKREAVKSGSSCQMPDGRLEAELGSSVSHWEKELHVEKAGREDQLGLPGAVTAVCHCVSPT